MDSRIPDVIQPLLQSYLHSLEKEVPDLVKAIYLHGSVALGAFDADQSDIDFVAILSRRCTDDDQARLRKIHQAVAAEYPRWQLEGGYVQAEDLGKPQNEIVPYPAFHDGKWQAAGHFEANDVTWWVIKNRGIALLGPNPQALDFTVDWEVLLQNMRDNLNTYWATWTKNPIYMAYLLKDEAIQWAVLGVLRQYYSFQENAITSKIGAGEYALQKLPVEWYPIVQEALNIRAQLPGSLYRSKIKRSREAVALLKFIQENPHA